MGAQCTEVDGKGEVGEGVWICSRLSISATQRSLNDCWNVRLDSGSDPKS